MNEKEISAFIKGTRAAKGLTQQELADKSKCTVLTIKRIEGGNFLPNTKLLIKVLKVLDSEIKIIPKKV